METINLRRSIRKYTNKSLDAAAIKSILQAAMQAPSARNQQPWHFLVIQDQQKIKAYAKQASNAKFLEEETRRVKQQKHSMKPSQCSLQQCLNLSF